MKKDLLRCLYAASPAKRWRGDDTACKARRHFERKEFHRACALLGKALLGALFLAPAWGQQVVPRPVLQTVEQIRSLSQSEAHSALPVHLKGSVLLLPGWRHSFFFSDGKHGIYVDFSGADPVLQAGDIVEIDGVSTDGDFAPSVNAKTIRYTEHHSLPAPSAVRPEDLRNGRQDSQWISLQGTVRSARIVDQAAKKQLFLSLDIGSGALLSARVLHFDPEAPARLEGAVVRIDGVCGSAFNTRRQFLGARLFARSLGDIHILQKSPADAFNNPSLSLASLLQFDRKPDKSERAHVEGTVTAVTPDGGFYLQQDGHGIFVETDGQDPPSLGTAVQAVGYVKTGTYSPTLVNASFRPAQKQPGFAVPLVSARSLLNSLDGYTYAPYDSLLIRLQGVLLETVRSAGEDLLLLRSDGVVITAKLPLRTEQPSPQLRVGSIVALTGISSTVTNEAHEARGTTLLLRSQEDIQVVHAAPWWTGVHVFWVIGVLCAILLLLVLWNGFMRRQARLRELIVRDSLTGLYNRRGFLLMAERQWNQAIHSNRRMLLFYIDLDRFKELNDTLGHKQGDVALQLTSNMLRDCFRKSDVIGRLGGDEFAVTALDGPDLQEDAVRGRMHQALAVANVKQGCNFDIGMSIGVLVCGNTHGPLSIEELLSRADELMYEQKRQRRLCVRGHSGMLALAPTPELASSSA